MYLPDHFVQTDPAAVSQLIAAHPLACIVAQTDQGLIANHIPLLAGAQGVLIGHVALNNDMHRLIGEGQEVLAIFRGEDAYVSPNLYPSKAETHRAVPTWNYEVVHVHGRITFQHEEQAKRAAVGLLTRDHERRANGDAGWRMADAPADYMTQMLAGIVGLRLTMDRVLAKSKISQNRTAADRAAVRAHLQHSGHAALAEGMARLDKGA
jgi:transcriptional regulator